MRKNPNLQCVFYLKRIWQKSKRNPFNFKHIHLQNTKMYDQTTTRLVDSNKYEDNELPDQAKSAPLWRPFRPPNSSSSIEPKINIKNKITKIQSQIPIEPSAYLCKQRPCILLPKAKQSKRLQIIIIRVRDQHKLIVHISDSVDRSPHQCLGNVVLSQRDVKRVFPPFPPALRSRGEEGTRGR